MPVALVTEDMVDRAVEAMRARCASCSYMGQTYPIALRDAARAALMAALTPAPPKTRAVSAPAADTGPIISTGDR